MGRQVVTDQQAGFSGGLNAVSDPAFLRPDQARQMANLRLSNYGAALKRLGSQILNASALTTFSSNGGGIYWPKYATIYLLTADPASSAIHLWSANIPVSLPATFTNIGALPQYRPVIFTDNVASQVLYVAGDASTAVYKYDHASISALGASTAKVEWLCVYNDRLWGGKGNSLYYSNLSSAAGSTGGDSLGDTSAGGGEIIVNTFGASDIVVGAPVNGSLILWHQRGISVLTGWGQDDIAVQPQVLNADVGMGIGTPDGMCVASELTTGDVAYFATYFGIFATNGGYVRPLGSPDKPDPTAALLAAGTHKLQDFVLRYNRQYNELWVLIQGTGVYVYNVILQAWSGPFTGAYTDTTQSLFEVLDVSQLPKFWRATLNGSAGTGLFVSECDYPGVYKDNVASNGTGGTAVTATLQLHRMFGGDRVFAKSWRWINLLATLTAGDTEPVITTSTPIGGTNTNTLSNLVSVEQAYYVSPGGQGAYLDVTITDAGTMGTSQYALATVQGNLLGQR